MFRRRAYRRYPRRVPRGLGSAETGIVLRRSGQPVPVTLVAGGVTAQARPKLSECVTSDITALFREYRVLKCIVRFSRRVDAGSGSANQTANLQIATACDPEGVNPTAFNEITAYSNHKRGVLSSERTFTYTFYPKVINSVAVIPGTSVASVGTYSRNPWLQCTPTGVTVEMNNLAFSIVSTLSTDVSTVEYVIDYVFQVRGIS